MSAKIEYEILIHFNDGVPTENFGMFETFAGALKHAASFDHNTIARVEVGLFKGPRRSKKVWESDYKNGAPHCSPTEADWQVHYWKQGAKKSRASGIFRDREAAIARARELTNDFRGNPRAEVRDRQGVVSHVCDREQGGDRTPLRAHPRLRTSALAERSLCVS